MNSLKPIPLRLSPKNRGLIDRAAREATTNAILDERILRASHQQFEKIETYLNSADSNELFEKALQKSSENPLW
tara:strand:+ start:757 stop:978 length:222 start_codon:yes stop_codon:yes gene_type:complete